MITKADVILAYKLLLGREPESDKAINNQMQNKDFKGLREALICSNEFNEKYRRLKGFSSGATIYRSDIEEEKLIFLHIPKTGGTTLHSILAGHFKTKEICPERFNTLYDNKAGKLASYRFFSGHYDYYSAQVIPGHNKKMFTIFREPTARLISFYYFLKSHRIEYSQEKEQVLPILANKYSFAEFMKCPEMFHSSNIYNPYTMLLTGRKPSGEYTTSNDETVLNHHDQELLEETKEVVNSFSTFGILEYYDESVSLMLNKLGLPAQQKIEKKMVLEDLVKSKSHKAIKKKPINSEEERLLQYNTYLDQQVYQYVVKEFRCRHKSFLNS